MAQPRKKSKAQKIREQMARAAGKAQQAPQPQAPTEPKVTLEDVNRGLKDFKGFSQDEAAPSGLAEQPLLEEQLPQRSEPESTASEEPPQPAQRVRVSEHQGAPPTPVDATGGAGGSAGGGGAVGVGADVQQQMLDVMREMKDMLEDIRNVLEE